jgi:hypothetical protein
MTSVEHIAMLAAELILLMAFCIPRCIAGSRFSCVIDIFGAHCKAGGIIKFRHGVLYSTLHCREET